MLVAAYPSYESQLRVSGNNVSSVQSGLKQTTEIWVGKRRPLPISIAELDGNLPEVHVWACAQTGAVLAVEILDPNAPSMNSDYTHVTLADTLLKAMYEPAFGERRAPSQVIVDDASEAVHLNENFKELLVTVGDVPQAEEALISLAAHMAAGPQGA